MDEKTNFCFPIVIDERDDNGSCQFGIRRICVVEADWSPFRHAQIATGQALADACSL